jgi:hypothetical protein
MAQGCMFTSSIHIGSANCSGHAEEAARIIGIYLREEDIDV